MTLLQQVLRHRDALTQIGARIPVTITNLGEEQVENVARLFKRLAVQPELLLLAMALLHGRLAYPWQLIRLAVSAAESDVASRIAQTPFAIAVTLVLADLHGGLDTLRDALRRGAVGEAIEACKELHDASRALRSEMELTADSAWNRDLSATRAQISDVLRAEIERVPGLMRRLLRPRPAREIASGATLDPVDVAAIEAQVDLVRACRNYAGELALNQVAPRVYTELQSCLDLGASALIDALRSSGEGERAFRQAQVDAAGRLGSRLFGPEYAGLLAKAAAVASAEQKITAQR